VTLQLWVHSLTVPCHSWQILAADIIFVCVNTPTKKHGVGAVINACFFKFRLSFLI